MIIATGLIVMMLLVYIRFAQDDLELQLVTEYRDAVPADYEMHCNKLFEFHQKVAYNSWIK